MVFPTAAKNRLRDLMASDVNLGMCGTGASAEDASDVTLATAATASSEIVTTATSDRQLVVDYSLPATEINGSTITEFGIFGSDGTLYSRQIFSSFTKSSNEQWQFSAVYHY